MSALCQGPVRLKGALFSRDSALLVDNLKLLGFQVKTYPESGVIEIEGTGGQIPNAKADLFVGNAGTVARFLTAFLCLHPDGTYRLDGDEEMRSRPMTGLLDALRSLGARIFFEDKADCFPFSIQTCGLPSGRWFVDAKASSQMLSALMMVAPYAAGDVILNSTGARPSFVNMTASQMRQFGSVIDGSPQAGFRISNNRPYAPPGEAYSVEPDATAASYFLALPLVVGGELTVRGLRSGMLQGDMEFLRVLESIGLRSQEVSDGWRVSRGETSTSREMRSYDFECFSDTFLTLAAVAPVLSFPVTIKGIGHTRHQETDRIHAMTTELRRVGVAVEEGRDFLGVKPFQQARSGLDYPVTVQTYRDHRVAMSMAILGCSNPGTDGDHWLNVADPGCSGKTFPGFFETLSILYRKCHDKKSA